MAKKIAIGADHGGYSLKSKVKEELKRAGYRIEDMGTCSDDASDYPGFAFKVARDVSKRKAYRGIVICKSGIGHLLSRTQSGDQSRNDLEYVTDDTIIGKLKDRSVRIGIDGDDDIGFLNANDKMECAADAATKRHFRAADDSGLPDLTLALDVAFVYRGACCADITA